MRKKKQEKLEQKAQKKAARKKKILLGIVGVLAVLVIIGLIFWFSPRYFLKGVKADSVSKITVFDGTNGKKFDIDSSHNVKLIVENIQNTKMRCSGIAIGYTGFHYDLRFYDENGKEIISPLTVWGSSRLSKGAFFYNGDMATLIQYIDAIEKAMFPEGTE